MTKTFVLIVIPKNGLHDELRLGAHHDFSPTDWNNLCLLQIHMESVCTRQRGKGTVVCSSGSEDTDRK